MTKSNVRVLKDLSKQPAPKAARSFDGQNLTADFTPTSSLVQVGGSKREPLVVYTGEYKGKANVHIRKIWTNDADEWAPGKGVSFPAEALGDVVSALSSINE